MRPIPLAAANLGAVVPGFRSVGMGAFFPTPDAAGAPQAAVLTAQMSCVPAGFESIVAMRCPDGSIMPACGSGSCGAPAASLASMLPASVADLLARITSSSSAAPAPGNFGDGFKYIGYGVAALMLVIVLKGKR